MNLKQEIEELVVDNDFQAALDRLKQEKMSINQRDSRLALEQQWRKIKQDGQLEKATREEIRVRESHLVTAILAFTDNLIKGEPEVKTEKSIIEKISQTPSKNLLIAVLLLEIAIGILGELMPDEVKPILENIVGKENYWIAWGITFAVTIIAFLYFTLRKEKPKNTPTETNILAQETDKITKNLIERYESRLQQKTDKRLPVDLKITYTKEGTSKDYKHWDKDIRVSQKLKDNWVETLKKHQHILIVGKPGAGKSTQLLELAVAWLKDKTCSQIPVVFNLAPWTADHQYFHEWLQSTLVSGYGFSNALAKEAIEKNQILPLLDGLDEVGTKEATDDKKNELRSHCLNAIDRYLSLFDVPYTVICSRIDEYAAAADAPIKAQVLVNELTPKQIRQTLTDALGQKLHLQDENAANNLLDLIKNHPTLEKVVCTPFYYNIALDVFAERTKKHHLPDGQEDLGKYLVETFLDKKLATTKNKLGYSKEETRHYLGFVASFLDLENIKNFELVSFQQRHLSQTWRMNWVHGLSFGLFLGLFLSLSFGLFFGLFFGAIGSGLLSLIGRLEGSLDINTNGIRKINWSMLVNFSTWTNSIAYSLLFSFTFSLVFSSVFGLLFVLFFGSFSSLFKGLIFGLNMGLGMGFFGGLVGGVGYKLFDYYTFINIEKPYHRLKNKVLFEVLQLMLIGQLALFTILYFQSDIQNISGLYYLLGLGLLLGIIVGLFNTAFFRHFILRLCLKWEQKLPLRWVSFFKYATDARILEQDGGQWRFRHQLLEDYFLEVWKRDNS